MRRQRTPTGLFAALAVILACNHEGPAPVPAVPLGMTVKADGNISHVAVTASSHIPLLDEVGKQVLETLSPLDPPPSRLLTGDQVELPFTFEMSAFGSRCQRPGA